MIRFVFAFTILPILIGCNPPKKSNPADDIKDLQVDTKQLDKNSDRYKEELEEAFKLSLDTQKLVQQVRVDSVGRSYSASMLKCGEKLWPGYNWKQKQILLFDSIHNLAWLWIGGENEFQRVLEIDASLLPSHVLDSAYSFLQWEGQLTVAISLDQADQVNAGNRESGHQYLGDRAISLALHEGFHLFEQLTSAEPWSTSLSNMTLTFPQDVTPRYLRKKLGLILLKAYQEVNPSRLNTLLSQAAWLRNRWKQQYSEELPQALATEVVEGSAMYVEAMATQYALIGCEDNQEVAHSMAWNYMQEALKLDQPMTNLVLEAYQVGGLSALLLDKHHSDKDWKGRVEAGESPVDLLLENIAPSEVAEDQDLLPSMSTFFDEYNSRLASKMEEPIEQMASPDYVRVMVDSRFFSEAALNHEGEFLLSEHGGIKVMLGNFIERNTEDTRLKAMGVSSFQDSSENCSSGREDWVFLVKKEDFSQALSGRRLDLNTSDLEIRGSGATKEISGMTYFCLPDAE